MKLNINGLDLTKIFQHLADDWFPFWSPVTETLD
jgi:hypothetical protein